MAMSPQRGRRRGGHASLTPPGRPRPRPRPPGAAQAPPPLGQAS
eukprot:CAMPEP_0204553914 /NCGR_PEP_ID=MMETSP0661-20131031/27706_1 /ASSEMBLY_ACC=CAM_ASM_000606 /TAXON_ID=109239 /ORGANISM="Alexandrium margalefi, Strain AMGDE01CS-322" /LENGTH=43 /DNA_ID= /DNA_START= /DNA_END= /DNA_ORIENTATION=